MKDFIIPSDRDFGTPYVRSTATVTLNIDGFDVTVPEGTSIMRAAAEIGITVPKLCATDSLDAFGSCRLCLVEIEGRNGTPACVDEDGDTVPDCFDVCAGLDDRIDFDENSVPDCLEG